jgi:hypothetical protein
MVLCEGRTEEGTKQGTTASGGTLFKWCCREQRKGRGSGVGVHVRAGEEGRGGPVQLSAARGGRRAQVAALLREHVRAAGRDRRDAGVTDRWGQAAMGPSG